MYAWRLVHIAKYLLAGSLGYNKVHRTYKIERLKVDYLGMKSFDLFVLPRELLQFYYV